MPDQSTPSEPVRVRTPRTVPAGLVRMSPSALIAFINAAIDDYEAWQADLEHATQAQGLGGPTTAASTVAAPVTVTSTPLTRGGSRRG